MSLQIWGTFLLLLLPHILITFSNEINSVSLFILLLFSLKIHWQCLKNRAVLLRSEKVVEVHGFNSDLHVFTDDITEEFTVNSCWGGRSFCKSCLQPCE